MAHRKQQASNQIRQVISYEDDVHAWMYLDQSDGVLRYEAFVLGYDEAGLPTTLEFVIEEGALDLSDFPQIASFLPRALRARSDSSGEQKDAAAEVRGSVVESSWVTSEDGPLASWRPGWMQGGCYTPWDLARWQWDGLHAFCEAEERRLKRECRARWTRRLRALGYDVIRSL